SKTGKLVEKDSFIYQSIRKYPKYKEELETSLSNFKEKEERFGPAEELKEQKKSIKALKTGSNENDMDNAIEYYKDRKKKDKVIAIYKDKIYFSPHIVSNYYDLADYYKEVEKYKEAKEILFESLTINPYQSSVYELLGDIAKLEANMDEALQYYRKGKALNTNSGYFGYGGGITEKIEQIVGNENYKKIFENKTFEETLNNPDWLNLAENEDAIVLHYTKDCVIDTNQMVNMYQSLMIKILKESGIEKYNEIDMSFMGYLTSAKIIKENGTESTPERSGSYLVIKNLEAGDIIQVEGVADMQARTIFGNNFNHQHFLLFSDPVFYSKFDFSVPKGTFLGYYAHKLDKEPKKFTDSYNFDHYVWQNYNLPKIQDETAFPDYYDYYRSVSVSTIKDWETVNDWYEQTTYQKTDLTYEVKEILDTLIKPGMTDEIKVQKIYNYITTKIRYSYVAFLNSRFVPKWPGNTISAGIGDCKDVATLMITMLRAQGISSYYTLVKTNQYNRLETVPSLSFDHVIVCYELNGQKNYCDLTTNFYPYYVLPEMDNDAVALHIKPGEKSIFHLPNDLINQNKTNAKYTIDAQLTERDLKLEVKAEYTGTAGGNLREQIFRTAKNKYPDFASAYFGQDVFENSTYDKVEFVNLNDFSNPLQVNYSITSKGFADKVSGLFIIRMPYLESIRKTQAVIENERTNRMDLEKILNIYPSEQIINLKIPEGYKLAEIPENITHNSAFCNYSVVFKLSGNTLQIIKKQSFNKTLIEIEEFQSFKIDYQKLLDLDKFKIAIIKK
ncbi:MAG: transglutaminase domain-containing protein, partial [Bacteroidia bacterium]|nr:transglutaminase domain-containing protein [Bacteroidia bacterium]